MIFCFTAYKSLGVYGVNVTTGKRYHDTTGLPQKGGSSDYQILTPVFQIGDLSSNAAAVMFNLHSERRRAKAIDYAIDCVRMLEDAHEAEYGKEIAHERQFHQMISSNCTSMTEVVFLVQDPPGTRPGSLTLYPIMAYDDRNDTSVTTSNSGKKTVPPEVVGFVSAVHNWDTVLSISTNDKVSGIMAVLSNGIESHSFIYDNGVVEYVGQGDHHDAKYDSQRYEFDASSTTEISSFLTSTPLTYTVTLYPTGDWIDLFEDSIPAITCGVAVGLVVFTSVVFSLYDYLINRDVNEKELILQTKRQFVRYISHEIRTPLNVVLLGFQLLCTEMLSFPQQQEQQLLRRQKERDIQSMLCTDDEPKYHGSISKSLWEQHQQAYNKQFKDWLELIQDIVESAEAAITVLNDLMSYDKLDSGTMVIQRDLLQIWDLIATTVHPFTVQAKHKDIELELILQGLCMDEDDNNNNCENETNNHRISESSQDAIPNRQEVSPSLMPSLRLMPIATHHKHQPSHVPTPTSVTSQTPMSYKTTVPSAELDIEQGGGSSAQRSLGPVVDDIHRFEEENEVITKHQLVLGDKPKLCQVMRNLVSNALKFTPEGGKVTIRACWKPRGLSDAFEHLVNDVETSDEKAQESKSKVDMENYIGCGSLVLSVTDTGAGMSAEHLSRLFQEGVQFNANKLQAGQGSGLGLWISKGIVELHRGKLSATSKGEGCGATFTLELPVLLPRKRHRKTTVAEEKVNATTSVGNIVAEVLRGKTFPS